MVDNYSAYMSANLEKYVGEWVGFVEGKVVAHGLDFKEVYQSCRKIYPSKVPFLACVPKPMAMIL